MPSHYVLRAFFKTEGINMVEYLTQEQINWCDAHAAEALDLLRTLGKIPAPSHHEEKRAAFVQSWLEQQGLQGVHTDSALNVVCPIGVTDNNPVVVLMAHMDIVFFDTDELLMREEDGKLYAPGIGDDTANLVALMMAAKYVAEHRPAPRIGVLIVANSCEEGLGNLKGSMQIMQDYAGRVVELISIDGGMERIVNDAVGSHRMRVTIRAQGGHSYGAFGNTNAIVQMAQLITRLYEKQPPTERKTTYNVGVIEGGTTVNSICAECSILYEYRSESRDCLAEMEAFFNQTIEETRASGVDVSVDVLGVRPCASGVDPERLHELTVRMAGLMNGLTGRTIRVGAGSTDANSPLSQGVPAVTIGGIDGALAHTRGEWIDTASLRIGQRIALASLLQYFYL